jgi:hypothetical protein
VLLFVLPMAAAVSRTEGQSASIIARDFLQYDPTCAGFIGSPGDPATITRSCSVQSGAFAPNQPSLSATFAGFATYLTGYSLGASLMTSGYGQNTGGDFGGTVSVSWNDVLKVQPLSSLSQIEMAQMFVEIPWQVSGGITGYSDPFHSWWFAQANAMIRAGSSAQSSWSDLMEVDPGGTPFESSSGVFAPLRISVATFAANNWIEPLFLQLALLSTAHIGSQAWTSVATTADFSHTATLGEVRVVDENGDDLSQQFSLTTGSGRTFGAVVVTPEPSSIALLVTGLIVVFSIARWKEIRVE